MVANFFVDLGIHGGEGCGPLFFSRDPLGTGEEEGVVEFEAAFSGFEGPVEKASVERGEGGLEQQS